jgi:hypothetical protein
MGGLEYFFAHCILSPLSAPLGIRIKTMKPNLLPDPPLKRKEPGGKLPSGPVAFTIKSISLTCRTFSWHFACQFLNKAAISLFQGICASPSCFSKPLPFLNDNLPVYLLGRFGVGSKGMMQNKRGADGPIKKPSSQSPCKPAQY